MYSHLKDLRESLGMTQEEFGKSIGVAKSTYNNYEKGIRDPKSDFWITVAKKYDVTIDYLMGYSDDPHKTTALAKDRVSKELLDGIANLDKEDQMLILAMLKRLEDSGEGGVVRTKQGPFYFYSFPEDQQTPPGPTDETPHNSTDETT